MKTIDHVLDFCIELGKRMISSGANIERVNYLMEHIAYAYGLSDIACSNLTTRVSISARDKDNEYRQRQSNVPPQVINLEKLKKINDLAYEVIENMPKPNSLLEKLNGIHTNDFPWWMVLGGFLVAMMALCRIFCGTFAEEVIVILNTLILYGLSKVFAKFHVNRIVSNFIGMFLCSCSAIWFFKLGFVQNFYIVIITNAFFLIPGIPMVNSVRNILCGNEMNGTIDLLKVFLEICTIVAGVGVGMIAFSRVIVDAPIEEYIVSAPINWLTSIELVVLTLLTCLGFGIVFNIQLRDLPFAALGGIVVRVFLILFQLALPNYRFAFTTLAALCAALYSEITAAIRKEPTTLYLYPAIVPLIPGDLLYYTGLGIIWQNRAFLGKYGPDLGLVLVGISVGFVISSTFVHYMRRFRFVRKITTAEEN